MSLHFSPRAGSGTRRVRWQAGWFLIVPGALIYLSCLIRFLLAGGTPAIFFTRPLRFLIGEEPKALVADGLYRYTRNPMYVGVLLAVIGQAILYVIHEARHLRHGGGPLLPPGSRFFWKNRTCENKTGNLTSNIAVRFPAGDYFEASPCVISI